ncbi:MAG: hypothetical protein PHO56_03825 [Patescibacteria group bacterium]|nr:hypothetical protein [Patescibacteria group bacterium]
MNTAVAIRPPLRPPNFLRIMQRKKPTLQSSRLTEKFQPKGPDLMGEPPSCMHLEIFKSESSPKGMQKRVNRIFKNALAAKKKSGR